jgi:hypothetical protein
LSAVQASTLGFADLQRDLDRDRRPSVLARELDPGMLLPEADQLRVGARSR